MSDAAMPNDLSEHSERPRVPLLYGNSPNMKLRAQGALVKKVAGPIGMACGCALCDFTVREQRPPRGQGRVWGFAAYGRLRGAVVRHLKDAHPEELDAMYQKWGVGQ